MLIEFIVLACLCFACACLGVYIAPRSTEDANTWRGRSNDWYEAYEAWRELAEDRGVTIDNTQLAVEKWKRRAALKTAEVHRLRNELRDRGAKEAMVER